MTSSSAQKPAGFTVRTVAWSEAGERLNAVRREVFIEEQQVPEDLERDGLDPACVHALAEDEAGNPIGTGRLLPDGHIGRMAVLKPWRGRSVGAALLLHLLQCARERGMTNVVLNAQISAVGFYERYGFTAEGETFTDAGIPHVRMVRRTNT